MKKITVNINGVDYNLKGREDEEYLQEVAAYVDEKLKEILAKNPVLSTSQASVLACINMTDELYKSKGEVLDAAKANKGLSSEKETLFQSITDLKEDLIKVKEENEKIKAMKENQLGGFKKDREELLNKNTEVKNKLDLVMKEKIALENEVKNKSNEIKRINEEKAAEIKKINEEKAAEIKKINEEKATLVNEGLNLKRECGNLKIEKERLIKSATEKESKIHDLKDEIIEKDKIIKGQKDELDKREISIRNLKNNEEKLIKEKQEIKKTAEEDVRKINLIKEDVIKKLKNESILALSRVKAESEEKEKGLDSKHKKIVAEKDALIQNGLNTEKGLLEKISNLEKAYKNEISELNTKNVSAKKDIDGKAYKIEVLSKEVSECRKEIQALKSEIEVLINSKNSLKDEMDMVLENRDELKSEIKISNEYIKECEEKNSSLEGKISTLESEIENTVQKYEKTMSKFNEETKLNLNLRDRLNELEVKMEKEIEEKSLEIENINKEIKEKDKEISYKAEMIEELEKGIDKLKKDRTNLFDSGKTNRLELQSYKYKVVDLENKLKEKSIELAVEKNKNQPALLKRK